MRHRFGLGIAALLAAAPAQAQDEPSSVPLCVYDSRSFSEGASICVQRHLMMACALADNRAVWTLVTDRTVSRLCAGPSRATIETAVPPRRQLARRMPARSASPPASAGAKCFTFDGRRFCE